MENPRIFLGGKFVLPYCIHHDWPTGPNISSLTLDVLDTVGSWYHVIIVTLGNISPGSMHVPKTSDFYHKLTAQLFGISFHLMFLLIPYSYQLAIILACIIYFACILLNVL